MIRHNEKSNVFQVALRDAVFAMLELSPGLTFSEIHCALLKTDGLEACTNLQARTAMDWLRDKRYVRNGGDKFNCRYFLMGDDFIRNSIPAIGAKPLKCNVMPEKKCKPLAWSAFMLLNSVIAAPVTNKRKSNQQHHRAKLSDADCEQMRALYVPHVYGYGRIAKQFNCPDSTVRDIVQYLTRVAL